jgi:hypothetical protein
MSDSVETEVILVDERVEARKNAVRAYDLLQTFIRDLLQGRPMSLQHEMNGKVEKIVKSGKQSVSTLSKKQKKSSKNSSENLVRPCLVVESFSDYVRALRDENLLGDVQDEAKEALTRLIDDGISSLLVSTLLISCDIYQQPKREEATFYASPLMKEHLADILDEVSQERIKLREKDNKKNLFDQDNFSSAMNNVIASYLRNKEGEVGRTDELADVTLATNLACLQAYLKENNAVLRKNRK